MRNYIVLLVVIAVAIGLAVYGFWLRYTVPNSDLWQAYFDGAKIAVALAVVLVLNRNVQI